MQELYLSNQFHAMTLTVRCLPANSWLLLILLFSLLKHDLAPKATCKGIWLRSRKRDAVKQDELHTFPFYPHK